MHRPAAPERLVAAVEVEGELAELAAVGGDDADLGAADQEQDLAVAVGGADWDVAQLAQVAQSDLAPWSRYGRDAPCSGWVLGAVWAWP